MSQKTRCLLIETKEGRKFFTKESFYPQLIEFANTFHAELMIVEAEEPNMLSLNALSAYMSSGDYSDTSPYELIEHKIDNKGKRPRKINDEEREHVRGYVRNLFLKGEIVDLKELVKYMETWGLNYNYVCNLLSQTRKQLRKEGHETVKVGAGKYRTT